MTRTSPAALVPNPYNLILSQHRGDLSRAIRRPLATTCDPITKEVVTTAKQRRRSLKTIQIQAATAGENIIIPANLAGQKMIYEVVLWNVTAQDLTWQQGTSAGGAITLLELPEVPDQFGFTLGFNGNWEMAHWEIDNGQPLVLVLSESTRVTGFIRYATA